MTCTSTSWNTTLIHYRASWCFTETSSHFHEQVYILTEIKMYFFSFLILDVESHCSSVWPHDADHLEGSHPQWEINRLPWTKRQPGLLKTTQTKTCLGPTLQPSEPGALYQVQKWWHSDTEVDLMKPLWSVEPLCVEMCCCKCCQDLGWWFVTRPRIFFEQFCSFMKTNLLGNKVGSSSGLYQRFEWCSDVLGTNHWCQCKQSWTKNLCVCSVAGCHIQDPQVSGWLLDPADPSSCFHDLLNKHCKKYTPSSTPGARPVSTTALLHKHNIKVHLWFREYLKLIVGWLWFSSGSFEKTFKEKNVIFVSSYLKWEELPLQLLRRVLLVPAFPFSSQGSRFISALCSLYWLNLELRSKLQVSLSVDVPGCGAVVLWCLRGTRIWCRTSRTLHVYINVRLEGCGFDARSVVGLHQEGHPVYKLSQVTVWTTDKTGTSQRWVSLKLFLVPCPESRPVGAVLTHGAEHDPCSGRWVVSLNNPSTSQNWLTRSWTVIDLMRSH